jgi:hypothetical protein
MPNGHTIPNDQQLTRRQRKLMEELHEIASRLKLNYDDIGDYDPDERTTRLELIKRQIIIGEVITKYTLVDEFLSVAICNYFFGTKRSSISLWKTKKFRNFNYYVVEVLSLNEKLRFFKAVTKVPKAITNYVDHLVGLRNGLAHAYFPENLRSAKPVYKGKSIFTLDGIATFAEDSSDVFDFFVERIRI